MVAFSRFPEIPWIPPPRYNLRTSYGGGPEHRGRLTKWIGSFLTEGYDGFDDAIPESEHLECRAKRFDQAMWVLRHDGAAFVVLKCPQQNDRLQDRRELWERYPVRQVIISARPGGINFNAHYFLLTYEVVYLIAKPASRLVDGANQLGDVWRISPDRHDPAHHGLEHLPPSFRGSAMNSDGFFNLKESQAYHQFAGNS